MSSVLFVCLGNICRSPLAEGVLRQAVATQNLRLRVDSAGTGDWHKGSPPDSRAMAAAARAGLDISMLRARQVRVQDFTDFTHIIAMDRQNFADLAALRPSSAQAQVHLLLGDNADGPDVPDPYYGDTAGFDRCLDLIEQGVTAWLARHYPAVKA